MSRLSRLWQPEMGISFRGAFLGRHCFVLAAFCSLILAIVFRIVFLSHSSLWMDEAVSWEASRRDVRGLLTATISDHTTVGYFVVLKAWMAVFGDSVSAMRSLSVVCSVLAIAFAERVCCQLRLSAGDAQFTRIAVLLLFAVNPFQVIVGREARMYSMLSCLTLASSSAAIAFANAPDTRKMSVFSVACLATAMVHPFGLLAVASQYVSILLSSVPGRNPNSFELWGRLAFSLMLFCCGYAAWLPVLFSQVGGTSDFWIPQLTVMQGAEQIARFICHGSFSSIVSSIEVMFCAAVIVAVLVVVSLRQDFAGCWIVSNSTIPLVAALSPGIILGRNVFLHRYLASSQVWILIAFALILGRRSALRLGALTGTIVVQMWFSFCAVQSNIVAKQGYNEVARVISVESRVDDIVLCQDVFAYFPMCYYLRQSKNRALLYSDLSLPRFHGSAYLRADQFVDEVRLDELLKSSRRVWVVDCTIAPGVKKIVINRPPLATHRIKDNFWQGGSILVSEY